MKLENKQTTERKSVHILIHLHENQRRFQEKPYNKLRNL